MSCLLLASTYCENHSFYTVKSQIQPITKKKTMLDTKRSARSLFTKFSFASLYLNLGKIHNRREYKVRIFFQRSLLTQKRSTCCYPYYNSFPLQSKRVTCLASKCETMVISRLSAKSLKFVKGNFYSKSKNEKKKWAKSLKWNSVKSLDDTLHIILSILFLKLFVFELKFFYSLFECCWIVVFIHTFICES